MVSSRVLPTSFRGPPQTEQNAEGGVWSSLVSKNHATNLTTLSHHNNIISLAHILASAGSSRGSLCLSFDPLGAANERRSLSTKK